MKKLIYGSLFLALVGIGMVGCKKENVRQNEAQNTPNEFGISTDGRMLIFKTVDDYEKAIDGDQANRREALLQTIKDLKFENYFSKEQVESEKPEHKMDDFFGQLLSPESTIQIENHIYKIDLLKERVFVIPSNDTDLRYEDLINGNLNNKSVKEYKLTDDVLGLVNGRDTEKCASPDGFEIYTTSGSGTSLEFRSIIKLFTAGIYYRVTGRTKKIGGYGGMYRFQYQLVVNTTQIRRRPCSNNDVTLHYVGIKKDEYNNPEQVWEAYSKAWNVKSMYMYAKSNAEFIDSGATVYRSTPNVGISF